MESHGKVIEIFYGKRVGTLYISYMLSCYHVPAPSGGGIMQLWPLSVCMSVCLSPVPDPKSRVEGPSKLKIGRREAHDTGDPWPHLEV